MFSISSSIFSVSPPFRKSLSMYDESISAMECLPTSRLTKTWKASCSYLTNTVSCMKHSLIILLFFYSIYIKLSIKFELAAISLIESNFPSICVSHFSTKAYPYFTRKFLYRSAIGLRPSLIDLYKLKRTLSSASLLSTNRFISPRGWSKLCNPSLISRS